MIKFISLLIIIITVLVRENQPRKIFSYKKYALIGRTQAPTTKSSNNNINLELMINSMKFNRQKDEQLGKLLNLICLANEITNNKLIKPFKWNVNIKSK
jgi:hypothetical protein